MQEHIGRYEVRRELGRGGMAAVYLAFDPLFRRQVAIKVMPRQFTFDPRYLERFQTEAHTIANLEHPAIVPVHDFGEHEDAPFLVMRYMSGGTLQDRMSREPLSLDEVISILNRIAPALDKAHEMGVIHRDLKPANILFDDDGYPYLADFGIARLAEATQTMTVVGTPAYMSPEQVEGDVEPDGRSDIYSLGVMIYELLTGKQPYQGGTPTKQMVARLIEPLPDILQDNPNLPPDVQQVVAKAMAKNRDDRYDTPEPTSTAPAPETQLAAAASPVVVIITATPGPPTDTPEYLTDTPEPPPPTLELLPTNTAVPSETPTASATPEPERQAMEFVVGFESVNVRRGPGGVFRPIAIQYAGDVLEIIGRNSNATWLVVSLGDNASGWISSEVGTLQLDGSPMDIPLAATIPAWPTPTKTMTPTPTIRATVAATLTATPAVTISATETGTPVSP